MDKFLKPKKGQIVRDPISMVPLSEVGEYKPFIGPAGRYWRKKVKQGDCEIVEEIKKSSKKNREE